MVRGLKPWLWLPPKWSYQLGHQFLPLISHLAPRQAPLWREKKWRGLSFRSPLGLAGGVDKDATQIEDWWRLGVGFLEAGTVTPRPQPGHSGHIIDRVLSKRAVWNRLGFPGQGAEPFQKELQQLPKPYKTPLFVNIGKNATTDLSNAHLDYLCLIETLHKEADGFVVNVSSPNTAGLRELLRPQKFKDFIGPIKEEAHRRETPLLVKLSPDLQREDLSDLVKIGAEIGLDGWVLTNTSLGLREGLPFSSEGGVSGQPLASLSKKVLSWAVEELGPPREERPLLISVGGVLTAEDVLERLDMGADLVQVYSALIFEGPFFFHHVGQQVSKVNSLRRGS